MKGTKGIKEANKTIWKTTETNKKIEDETEAKSCKQLPMLFRFTPKRPY